MFIKKYIVLMLLILIIFLLGGYFYFLNFSKNNKVDFVDDTKEQGSVDDKIIDLEPKIIVSAVDEKKKTDFCFEIKNKSMKSVNKYEVGLGPNGEVLGYYYIKFGQTDFGWTHSDVYQEGTFACKDNVVEGSSNRDSYKGMYNNDRRILLWEGIEYQFM